MNKLKTTRKEYEKYLNEIGKGLSKEKFIIGGKQRFYWSDYGRLLRTYDIVAFSTGYTEWVQEHRKNVSITQKINHGQELKDKLKIAEEELIHLISKTNDTKLMHKFIEWQTCRTNCNKNFNEILKQN